MEQMQQMEEFEYMDDFKKIHVLCFSAAYDLKQFKHMLEEAERWVKNSGYMDDLSGEDITKALAGLEEALEGYGCLGKIDIRLSAGYPGAADDYIAKNKDSIDAIYSKYAEIYYEAYGTEQRRATEARIKRAKAEELA